AVGRRRAGARPGTARGVAGPLRGGRLRQGCRSGPGAGGARGAQRVAAHRHRARRARGQPARRHGRSRDGVLPPGLRPPRRERRDDAGHPGGPGARRGRGGGLRHHEPARRPRPPAARPPRHHRTGRAMTALRPPVRPAGRLAALARPATLVAALAVAVVLLWALAPGLFTGHDPVTGVPAERLQAPGAAHWFGTDHLGRDLYARTVHGTSLSVRAALLAIAVALVAGSAVGLVAGFTGGPVDEALMRGTDVLLAIPGLLLSLAVVTALGFGTV